MERSELLADVAIGLAGFGSLDARLDQALERMGLLLGVSRAYIFVDRPDGLSTDNTNEWCASGIAPQRGSLQGVPYDLIPSWKALLETDGRILAADASTLPPDMAAVLAPQGIRSILVYPLFPGDERGGFIGFDDCRSARAWSLEELAVLRAAAGMVSAVMERDLERERLAEAHGDFRRFVDSLTDIVVIAEGDGRIAYANAAARARLAYSDGELEGLSLPDLRAPEPGADAGEAFRASMEALSGGGKASCSIDLARKDGSRVPVASEAWLGRWYGRDRVFCVSRDASGERSRDRLFARLFQDNPAPMAISDAETGRFMDVNRAFSERLGYGRDEILGRKSSELGLFVHPSQLRHSGAEMAREGQISNYEMQVRRKDGSIIDGLLSGGVIESRGERRFITVMADISDQVELRERLESHRRRLRNIIDSTGLGTWEWHVPSGRLSLNERWAGMLGYSLAELEPTSLETWRRLTVEDDLAKAEALLERHFAGETEYYEAEFRMRHRDGSEVWVLDRGRVVERHPDGSPLMMFGTHLDISEKKRMEERIRDLAIRDPLLGIYNRRYLFERLRELAEERARGGRTFCVSMMDLDGFKGVNDRYGHLFGDEVLRAFASRVGATVRPYDLFGRYGGEEFLLVSVDTDAREAGAVIERLLSRMRSSAIEHEGDGVRITFSCGLADGAEYPPGRLDVDALVALADRRLYEAKSAGKDRLVGPSD